MDGTYFKVNGNSSVSVLCFDRWSDGTRDAWTVTLPRKDFVNQANMVHLGQLPSLGANLCADYDNESFDIGSEGYDSLVRQVERGEWRKW